MKLTLGKKLGLGFGVILALMVLSAVLTYSKASAIKETQTTITSMRTPTVDACKDLQRELNQTQSKGRQAILAGSDSARWEDAKKAFDASWDEIGKIVARLDDLSPHWSLQANRDRLAEVKKQLPVLREIQETVMKKAAGDERDAVAKAGNEFADKATVTAEAIKKPLGDLVDTITNVEQGKHRGDEWADPVDESDHGDHDLSGAGRRNFCGPFPEPEASPGQRRRFWFKPKPSPMET